MNLTTTTLVTFFRRDIPRLPRTYRWKIPRIDGLEGAGQFSYEANRRLKTQLTQRWAAASDGQQRARLAKIIVSDWGGVRGNSQETIRQYLAELESDLPKTPLYGVASYSKILSIAKPDIYAIYDARVAACLNAIQINAGLADGLAFNYVPGRNNRVGNAIKKQGFTQTPRFSVKSLCRVGWSRIRRDDTYQRYLQVLRDCLVHLPGVKLVDLEMALFSNAERECWRAMRRAPVSISGAGAV